MLDDCRALTDSNQHGSTFLRNNAHGIVACDFFVSVTARFRILFVFVALEIGSRRLVRCNVAEHPTAEWRRQQLLEALAGAQDYRPLIHDRHDLLGQSTAIFR
jgi:putative transposase